MARNRFEQVDEKQDDAVTLSLWKVGDSMYGTVTIPAALSRSPWPTISCRMLTGAAPSAMRRPISAVRWRTESDSTP